MRLEICRYRDDADDIERRRRRHMSLDKMAICRIRLHLEKYDRFWLVRACCSELRRAMIYKRH